MKSDMGLVWEHILHSQTKYSLRLKGNYKFGDESFQLATGFLAPACLKEVAVIRWQGKRKASVTGATFQLAIGMLLRLARSKIGLWTAKVSSMVIIILRWILSTV
jgi:hypothetical protein